MEANIWFYTFSTAAQVMAGLVGLFAVFVVYKIQDFGDTLESVRKQFVNVISHASNNTDDYVSIKYEDALVMDDSTVLNHANKLLALYNDVQKPQKLVIPHLTRENRDLFQTLISTKRYIVHKLVITLVLSLLAIAISLFALIATNYFIGYNHAVLFQNVFYLYFLFCLGYMGVGIYKIAIK
ncbi:MAG: hypothetical protein JWN49_93 [Parcubacteria group bacterium]|nr:hypothetical protein [Parcubacteria group bacterium]